MFPEICKKIFEKIDSFTSQFFWQIFNFLWKGIFYYHEWQFYQWQRHAKEKIYLKWLPLDLIATFINIFSYFFRFLKLSYLFSFHFFCMNGITIEQISEQLICQSLEWFLEEFRKDAPWSWLHFPRWESEGIEEICWLWLE